MTQGALSASDAAPGALGSISSAARAEIAICVARMILVGAMMLRLAVINPPLSAWVIAAAAALVVFVFSGLAINRLRAGAAPRPWLWASTGLDSGLSFAIVANNILTPWSGFPGVLALPDTVIFVIVTIAAGFRHSLAIVAVATSVNLCLILALVRMELAVLALPMAPKDVGLWAIFILAAGCAAGIAAGLLRALAARSAADTLRLATAHAELRSVLAGHHDVHSILTAVTLNASMLKRGTGAAGQRPSPLVEDLLQDLEAAARTLQALKTQAHDGLTRTLPPERVALSVELPMILSRAQASAHPLRLALRTAEEEPLPDIRLAGGATSLRRILANLMSNAKVATCQTPSPEFTVSAQTEPEGLWLCFDDNGPGFGAGPLKLSGLGVGLQSVQHIVEASGGEMTLEASPQGGARVALWLPVARG